LGRLNAYFAAQALASRRGHFAESEKAPNKRRGLLSRTNMALARKKPLAADMGLATRDPLIAAEAAPTFEGTDRTGETP
jgi:hypothetical protein